MAGVLVITGPSGVGKGTLIRRLLDRCPSMQLSVSATTRAPRHGEENGRDYHFLTREEFLERVARDEFVEHAEYAGHHYGTLRSELERPTSGIVLEIDLQGARQVRQTLPEATRVFIEPPSFEALADRLRGRASDSSEQIARRLDLAAGEMAAAQEFTHVVRNDDLDVALAELIELAATLCAPDPRESSL